LEREAALLILASIGTFVTSLDIVVVSTALPHAPKASACEPF
jgi:hypothetical protein